MYFSFSLLSTVAFGDIIGENYFEDVYFLFIKIDNGLCFPDNCDNRNSINYLANVYRI